MSMQSVDSNTPTGFKLRDVLRGHQETINNMSWSPDGNFLASVADDTNCIIWDLNTCEQHKIFDKHITPLYSVAWSCDGKKLATGSYGPTIRIWDFETGKVLQRFRGHNKSVYDLTWMNDPPVLVSASADRTIRIWSIDNPREIKRLKYHSDRVLCLAPSPDRRFMISGSKDRNLLVWDWSTWKNIRKLLGHCKGINCLTWSHDGRFFVSGSDDGVVRIWDIDKWRTERILECNTTVSSVSFSHDSRLLAISSEDDTVQIRRTDSWNIVSVLIKPDSFSWRSCAKFHPTLPILTTLSEGDKSIYIWDYDIEALLNKDGLKTSITYKNAKVVLVGDTGVGKSGLGMVLKGEPWSPTESTHGRRVWTLFRQIEEFMDGNIETRETILWDLAGQPGYRLVHQLHLNEVVIALIVFDARSDVDPFAGVRYWVSALNQALRIQGDSALPLVKFLVAARSDRGSVGVSKKRIDELKTELGVRRYFETSAKEGWGIESIKQAIQNAIDWNALAKVNSNRLFQTIKTFLISIKSTGRLLYTYSDLYQDFLTSEPEVSDGDELCIQFNTCIGRVESRGLIRKLSFGKLILLQPELLDSYASSLINAARGEPDGMGCISEEIAYHGKFNMPIDERIGDEGQERLLLIATVEDMLKQELVLRESTSEGVYLVFPSQFTRVNPDLPVPQGLSMKFMFAGPIINIYTTLVIRLTHSGLFSDAEMWKNAVIFSAKSGGTCGLYLDYEGEGKAELITFFNDEASEQTHYLFEEFIYTHLLRRASQNSLNRNKILVCPKCNTFIPERHVKVRQERGHNFVLCSICYPEEEVNVYFENTGNEMDFAASEIEAMDLAADTERDRETAKSILRGKRATGDYDVFLCYNSDDNEAVKLVADSLMGLGLLPWIDERELRPGFPWQPELENQINHIKSAAIFIGKSGIGPWQNMEQMAFIKQFIKRGLPVIPVVLADCKNTPDFPPFLDSMSWVDMRQDDPPPLEKLAWGITGNREYLEGPSDTFSLLNDITKPIVQQKEDNEPDIKEIRSDMLSYLNSKKISIMIVIIKKLEMAELIKIRNVYNEIEQNHIPEVYLEQLLSSAKIVINNLLKTRKIKKIPAELKSIHSVLGKSDFSFDHHPHELSIRLALPIIMFAAKFEEQFRFRVSNLKILLDEIFSQCKNQNIT